jgi:hypothetical protein
MARFAASSAFHEDWPVAMDLALSALDMPEDANLGFVYFADHYGGDLQEMFERLTRLTGIENWVGTSSVGVIGRAIAAQDQPGLSLLVGSLPEGSFRPTSPWFTPIRQRRTWRIWSPTWPPRCRAASSPAGWRWRADRHR